MDDLVAVARSPHGTEFVIFISPPGSTLDDDGSLSAGLIGLLIRVVRAGRHVAASRWRVVVQERSLDGRLGPAVHRSSVNTEIEARAKSSDLVRLIQSGIPIT